MVEMVEGVDEGDGVAEIEVATGWTVGVCGDEFECFAVEVLLFLVVS